MDDNGASDQNPTEPIEPHEAPQPPEPATAAAPAPAPASGAPAADVHLGPPAEAPKRRKKRLLILAAVLAGLFVIVGGATAAVLLALRGSSDVLQGKVPADSLMYATAYLDPAASQKINLGNLLGKFPTMEGGDVEQRFTELADEAMSGSGLSFEQDVSPWLGSQVGLVIGPGGEDAEVAALIATSDASAAADTLAKLRAGDAQSDLAWKDEEYEGVTISSGVAPMMDMSGMDMDMGMDHGMEPEVVYTVVADTVVFASTVDQAKAVVDAATGNADSLADGSSYADTTALLPEARLATVYLNGERLAAILEEESGLSDLPSAMPNPFEQLGSVKGVGMSLSAESDGFAMKVAALTDADPGASPAAPHQNATVAWTPADAYGLIASTGVDQALRGLFEAAEQATPGTKDQLDTLGVTGAVEALAGDFGVVLNPGTSFLPSGALMLATDDDQAMRDFLDKVSGQLTPLIASSEDALTGGSLADSGITNISAVYPKLPVTWRTESYGSAEISYLPLPDPESAVLGIAPAYTVVDGMAIIATSPDEIKALIDAHGGDNLTSNPNYSASIAHADADSPGIFYMDLQAVFQAIREADPTAGEALDQVEPLKAIVVTGGGGPTAPTTTLFVLIT